MLNNVEANGTYLQSVALILFSALKMEKTHGFSDVPKIRGL